MAVVVIRSYFEYRVRFEQAVRQGMTASGHRFRKAVVQDLGHFLEPAAGTNVNGYISQTLAP